MELNRQLLFFISLILQLVLIIGLRQDLNAFKNFLLATPRASTVLSIETDLGTKIGHFDYITHQAKDDDTVGVNLD